VYRTACLAVLLRNCLKYGGAFNKAFPDGGQVQDFLHLLHLKLSQHCISTFFNLHYTALFFVISASARFLAYFDKTLLKKFLSKNK
jgi:hypothetical protein